MKSSRRFTWPFVLSVRSLAIFRIQIGLIIIFDLIERLRNFRILYGATGTMTLEGARLESVLSYKFYPSLWLESDSWQLSIFAIAFLAAVCLVLGLHTRIATGVCWFMLLSIYQRHLSILNGGNRILTTLLFFSLFLPLDRTLTWFEREKQQNSSDNFIFSGGSIVFTLFFCSLYLNAGLAKTSEDWWPNGIASYLALNLPLMATPFGVWLLKFPDLLRWSTFMVYFFEIFGSILLLFPWKHRWFRLVGVVGFMTMHAMFASTMRLGLFPFIVIAGLTALLLNPRQPEEVISTPLLTDRFSHLFFIHVCPLVIFTFLALLGVQKLRDPLSKTMPIPYDVADGLCLGYYWPFFSPGVGRLGGHLEARVIYADREVRYAAIDGNQVLWQQVKSSVTTPSTPGYIANAIITLISRPDAIEAQNFASFLCRQSYDESRPRKRHIEIIVETKPTPLPGEVTTRFSVPRWSTDCDTEDIRLSAATTKNSQKTINH